MFDTTAEPVAPSTVPVMLRLPAEMVSVPVPAPRSTEPMIAPELSSVSALSFFVSGSIATELPTSVIGTSKVKSPVVKAPLAGADAEPIVTIAGDPPSRSASSAAVRLNGAGVVISFGAKVIGLFGVKG